MRARKCETQEDADRAVLMARPTVQDIAVEMVRAERRRQDEKYRDHPMPLWFTILLEEIDELAQEVGVLERLDRAANPKDSDAAPDEREPGLAAANSQWLQIGKTVQVAAVALAMLENLLCVHGVDLVTKPGIPTDSDQDDT